MASSSPTVDELQELMVDEGGFILLPDSAYDEVYPGILIGEASIAKNKARLQSAGITHVLNCAEGTTAYHVQTGPGFYGDAVVYMGFEATDSSGCSLRPMFEKCNDFIGTAVEGQGRVLVHCREGVSRSATVVLAFLLARRAMTLRDAVAHVHKRRNVYPNDGFLAQLIAYEQELSATPS